MRRLVFLSVVLILIVAPFVASHDEDIDYGTALENMQSNIASTSLIVAGVATVLLFLLIILAVISRKEVKNHKKKFFLSIIFVAIIATLYLVGATLYLNSYSETHGPVHWHADFEIWACGNKIDLIDPIGFSNRIGTPVLHEHGDDRIHVEGVLVKKRHADLHNFFEVVGGELTNNSIIIPINEGSIEIKDGDLCNNKEGKLQVFLYRVTNPDPKKNTGFTYTQQKVEDFKNLILSPYSNVPPGDCIIIEFSENKEKTDKVCETYSIAIEKGDLTEI
jgi:hypothetical protein